jgi:hypothetical protein
VALKKPLFWNRDWRQSSVYQKVRRKRRLKSSINFAMQNHANLFTPPCRKSAPTWMARRIPILARIQPLKGSQSLSPKTPILIPSLFKRKKALSNAFASSGAWIRTKDLRVMSPAPISHIFYLRATLFSQARRCTIQTCQTIESFELLDEF